MNLPQFSGVLVSLQTPFDEEGRIDEDSLRSELDFCIRAGCHGLVMPVMAAEFFTLSDDERRLVTEITIEHTAKRVPVLAGVQGVSQQHAASFARHAADHGADGVIAMPPYTRTASPREITAYFEAISQASDLPIMIQNAPGPLGTPLGAQGLAALVEAVKNICYVKEEARPPGPRISALLATASSKLAGVIGGANGLWILNELERGACGTMPAAPFVDIQVQIWDLFQTGKRDKARDLQAKLLPLINLGSLYGVVFNKEVLLRRGVIKCTHCRDPQKALMDEVDLVEVELGLSELEPHFTV